MPEPRFIHLKTHSAYSLLEGALKLPALIKLADQHQMPAIGLTDTGNLFASLEFSEKAAGAGIQPIIGTVLNIDFADSNEDANGGGARNKENQYRPIALIATSEVGYNNLVKIVSASYTDNPDQDGAFVSIEKLGQYSAGLLCLSGGPEGAIDALIAEGDGETAKKRIETLSALFPDRFYIEIQRYGAEQELVVEPELLDNAYELNLPIVATNECFFSKEEDYEAHDALLCVAAGQTIIEDDRRRLTPKNYFRSPYDMCKAFEDLPEAIENTIEIAKRCHYRPLKRNPILPRFGGEDDKGEANELRRQAFAGLEHRLEQVELAPGLSKEDYEKRLNYELDIIEGMKFPGYFLIVADFIKWAKSRGIPVGPGRGSGAGSLVAYVLTITNLDPLRFDLLFERFLNPERVSMPDFDIDFCPERREEVIHYVQEKYGADQVAQIITFGSLQARAVLRDVGRVLQMPYGQVDRLCRLVPQNPANPVTLAQAIEEEPRFEEEKEEEIVERLLSISLKLEGLYRHASTHAAGIVIGDRPLDELVPIYRDPRSEMPVTQFNMKWVEQAGLVKFDFLGLKTLTVLEKTVQLLAKRGISIDLDTLPFDDAKTYEMLSSGDSVGVFQLESMGMRKALVEMRPDRLEDIIALVALYRPGPMANIPVYCARKHGEEEPEYLHPMLEPILSETFGVIVYQEQVMQVAQELSGYSLGEADLLRRAMGKKIKAEMDAQKSRFIEGALKSSLSKSQADEIFSLLAKFADYGFNKSHAAAYAVVAYHTAYLKANYPVEFFAASMTLELGNTDKINDFRRDANRLGVEVLSPSVNASGVEFDVVDGKIVYALGALKGAGRNAMEHIVELRKEEPFGSLTDFSRRINPRLVNKRTLEALVSSGALDCLDRNRAQLFDGVEYILKEASSASAQAASGQGGFFGNGFEERMVEIPLRDPWSSAETLQRELSAIGFYLSAHPLDDYREEFEKLGAKTWSDFARAVRAGAEAGRLIATVSQKQERKTRKGTKMAILQLSDPSGQFEAVAFSETLAENRALFEPGESILLGVAAENRAEGINVRIQSVSRLDDMVARGASRMKVFVHSPKPLESLQKHLRSGGAGQVRLVLHTSGDQEVEMELPGTFDISPRVASAIKTIKGVVSVAME